MSLPRIAFLGTGLMGAPMVRNLLKAGYEVQAWNRTREKAEPLAGDGARVCDSAHEAVGGAGFVITMLSDGTAVEDLILHQNVAGSMQAGAIVIDMSSIRPREARRHGEQLAALGFHQLDAPVSGGTRGAEEASLAIMAGGDAAVFDAARPALAAMGRPVLVGPTGAGQLAKLANQAIVAVTIGVVAEAMLLAEKGGANPEAVRMALRGGFADSIILQQHGQRMTTGNFVPGGKSAIQLKDINNALEEARANGLELPLCEQMQKRFRHLVEMMEGGGLDHSGIYLELLERNGLG